MDDFQANALTNERSGRRTYLVTYSQADLATFPTRDSFGCMIEEYFNSGNGKAKVTHWACCLEEHENEGLHYHVSLKLSAPKKWLNVKKTVMEKHDVVRHFSDQHDNYIAAYKYVSKTDKQVIHSMNHPDLSEVGAPKTEKSTKVYRESRKRARDTKKDCTKPDLKRAFKPKRLTNVDVSDFLLKQDIKSDTELFSSCQEEKR